MSGKALALPRFGLSVEVYESLAFQARCLGLGKGTVTYRSAAERRMYEGLFALIRKREREAGTAVRAEYGVTAMGTTGPTQDRVGSVTPIRRDRALDGRRPRAAARRSSEKSGDGGSDPDEPGPSRRVDGREGIARWAAGRRYTLTALTAHKQLAVEELAA